MSVIVVLVGLSLLVAGGFLVAFLWAVRSGQYDDRHTPGVRILFDDHPSPPPPSQTNNPRDSDHGDAALRVRQ